MKTQTQVNVAWWLEAGAEACSACESALHYEAMVYCAGCDRPICLLCVAAPGQGEIFCSECLEP